MPTYRTSQRMVDDVAASNRDGYSAQLEDMEREEWFRRVRLDAATEVDRQDPSRAIVAKAARHVIAAAEAYNKVSPTALSSFGRSSLHGRDEHIVEKAAADMQMYDRARDAAIAAHLPIVLARSQEGRTYLGIVNDRDNTYIAVSISIAPPAVQAQARRAYRPVKNRLGPNTQAAFGLDDDKPTPPPPPPTPPPSRRRRGRR